MTIQELERQLLTLDESDRQRPAHPTALADLLQSWEDDSDEQEQRETWELLQQVLD